MAEEVGKDLLVKMYRLMLKSRSFDDFTCEAFASGQMTGMAPHAGQGQEAIGVGGVLALREDDYMVPSHRGFAHSIAKGISLKRLLAEGFGRVTGVNKGKGAVHVCDPEHNNLGLTGIIGAAALVSAGVGWSIKIRKTDQVVMEFFGDGLASQADFYPALNVSAAWKLPVVFVCENNLYSMGTRITTVTATKDIADMAKPFGMPSVVVDGNDVIAVYKAAREAVKRAREGKDPTLIECKTYRWRPHFEGCSDHRPKEEFEEWKKKDPIKRFEKKLLQRKVLTEEKIQKMKKEVMDEIYEAATFAVESPYPDPEELYTDVYV